MSKSPEKRSKIRTRREFLEQLVRLGLVAAVAVFGLPSKQAEAANTPEAEGEYPNIGKIIAALEGIQDPYFRYIKEFPNYSQPTFPNPTDGMNHQLYAIVYGRTPQGGPVDLYISPDLFMLPHYPLTPSNPLSPNSDLFDRIEDPNELRHFKTEGILFPLISPKNTWRIFDVRRETNTYPERNYHGGYRALHERRAVTFYDPNGRRLVSVTREIWDGNGAFPDGTPAYSYESDLFKDAPGFHRNTSLEELAQRLSVSYNHTAGLRNSPQLGALLNDPDSFSQLVESLF